MTRLLAWQAALALPFVPLSLLYLVAVRAERIAPGFPPVVVLAALPLASAVVGVRALRTRPLQRGWHGALIAVAVLELVWAVVVAAMVGFAIAWRSG